MSPKMTEQDCPQLKNLFFNHCVLSTVVQYLDVSDLKNFRLVNTTWNEEASPILKRRAVIKFQNTPNFETRVALYLSEMKHFGHENFNLFQRELDSIAGLFKKPPSFNGILKLFEEIGPQIKYLHLDMPFQSISDSKRFKEMLDMIPNVIHLKLNITLMERRGFSFWITTPVQQLHSIKQFDICIWDQLHVYSHFRRYDGGRCLDTENDPNDAEVIKRLARLAPNAESINILGAIMTEMLKEVCITAKECLKAGSLSVVQHAQSLEIEDIEIISKWPVPLKRLEMCRLPEFEVTSSNEKLQILLSLFNRHSSTLEELSLSIFASDNVVEIYLPVFPKLKKFEIIYQCEHDRTEEEEDEVQSTTVNFNLNFKWYPTLNYKTYFPVLQELSMNCIDPSTNALAIRTRQKIPCEQFIPDTDEICTTLRVIDIPYLKCSCEQQPGGLADRIKYLFPNAFNKGVQAEVQDDLRVWQKK